MRYCILASGSKGNSVFVESHHGRFLIDVGLSARKIEERLATHEIDPNSIDAIVLTHAHSDHVRGVGVFSHRHGIPVHAHADTLESIQRILRPEQKRVSWNAPFEIKDVHFTPFRVLHDCDPTVGYLIRDGERTFAICTDLGVVTDDVRQHLLQAHAMLLESNHDPDMLMNGRYPWQLKERISGRTGHLSNHNAGELLSEVLHSGVRQVILGHLSLQNNTAELASDTVKAYVGPSRESLIDVIEQQTVSRIYDL